MSLKLASSGGGSVDLTAPSTASNLTVTLPSASGVIPYGAGAGQIQFPATQNPSSDVNCLDDYEEGTFTPVVEGVTTSGTGTYGTQVGYYTKIGRVVYYSIWLAWSAHTGTGNMRITGLPFTVGAGLFPASFYTDGLTVTAGNYPIGYPQSSTTNLALAQVATGGGGATNITMDTSVTALAVSGFYFV